MQLAFAAYVYPREQLAEAARDVAEAGFAGLELNWSQLYPARVTPESLAETKTLLAGNGLAMPCFSAGPCIERFQDANKASCDLAEAFGANQWFVLPPSKGTSEWPEFLRLVHELHAYGATKGITLSLHHHLGTIVETMPETLRFLEETQGDIGICYDFGHLIAWEADVAATVRALGKAITHVHVKDVDSPPGEMYFDPDTLTLGHLQAPVERFVDLGEGQVDMPAMFGALRDTGYDGWCTVEIDFNRGAPRDHVVKSMAQLRKVLG